MTFNSLSDLTEYIKRDKYTVTDAMFQQTMDEACIPGTRHTWADGTIHVKQSDGSWPEENSPENTYKDDDSESPDGIHYTRPSEIKECEVFKESLITAKETVSRVAPHIAWRVDTEHDPSEYMHDKICTTSGGSVAAVTDTGDIISVCKNMDGGEDHIGTKLLESAVKAGGKKLDSYDGNFYFYQKNGFEPVSWCKFDVAYAPPGWNPHRDRKENIVFFKYTGRKNLTYSRDEFYNSVAPSRNYFEAKRVRDKEV